MLLFSFKITLEVLVVQLCLNFILTVFGFSFINYVLNGDNRLLLVNELIIATGNSFCHLESMRLFILLEIAEMSIVDFWG